MFTVSNTWALYLEPFGSDLLPPVFGNIFFFATFVLLCASAVESQHRCYAEEASHSVKRPFPAQPSTF